MARADGRDEGGQLVMALLEGHVDVGPGALAAALQADDVVVGDHREEARQHDGQDSGDQERQLDGHGHADMLSMTPSASALKTAMPDADEPEQEGRVVVPGGGDRPASVHGHRAPGSAGQHEVSSGDPRSAPWPRGARRCIGTPGWCASGSSSGLRVGWPMPKPGMAALPQASSGLAASVPGGACRRDIVGDGAFDVAAERRGIELLPDVRPGQRLADDGDGLARLQASLTIAATARRLVEQPPRTHASSPQPAPHRLGALATVRSASMAACALLLGHGLRVVGRRQRGRAGAPLQTDRLLAQVARRSVERRLELPACAIGDHADAARAVRRRKCTARSSSSRTRAVVVGRLDADPVPDARPRLEGRGEGVVDDLDDAADADLAGGEAVKADVATAETNRSRRYATQAPAEEHDAEDDAAGGEGDRSGYVVHRASDASRWRRRRHSARTYPLTATRRTSRLARAGRVAAEMLSFAPVPPSAVHDGRGVGLPDARRAPRSGVAQW